MGLLLRGKGGREGGEGREGNEGEEGEAPQSDFLATPLQRLRNIAGERVRNASLIGRPTNID